MESFRFDDKLFQRGQTWRECIESWAYRRELFLERALQDFHLPQIEACSVPLPPTRIVVLYHPRLLDAMKTVPVLGTVFSRIPSLDVRFFSQDIYFPLLYEPFGRRSPQILVLSGDGHCLKCWGPRPEPITQQLIDLKGSGYEEQDRMLWDYNDKQFCLLLDSSLASFFAST